jgi:hypothetical protein
MSFKMSTPMSTPVFRVHSQYSPGLDCLQRKESSGHVAAEDEHVFRLAQ